MRLSNERLNPCTAQPVGLITEKVLSFVFSAAKGLNLNVLDVTSRYLFNLIFAMIAGIIWKNL